MSLTRGSEWFRWDLHIHTPKSIVNNYGGDTEVVWNKFIDALENLPKDVKVIGINDYYFIDGFEKVMEYRRAGRLQNIKKIFPVVEYRVDTFGSANRTDLSKVNLHVLFDFDESKYDEELHLIKEQFLGEVHLSKAEEHSTVPLTRTNLQRYANENNLQNGFNEIIPSTDEIKKLINSDTWKKRTFIFLGYKEWDNLGLSNQLESVKRKMFELADAFFTGSPTPVQTRKQNILDLFGDKPLVHSMDIHEFSQLEPANYNCFSWVKAGFTLEGLKQIKFEPKERIILKNTNPIHDESKTNVIEYIQIKNSNKWFISDKIPLNRGLVAIIGEKGAGKTALLDMIAISNGEGIYESDRKNPSSFYHRASNDNQLTGVSIDVKYEGGEEIETIDLDTSTVGVETNKNAKVRYLSLKELENYSSNKEVLQDFIKSIINSNDATIKDIQMRCSDLIKDIVKLNSSIHDNILKLAEKNEKDKALKAKSGELSTHVANQPQVGSLFSEADKLKFTQLLEKEANINKSIKDLETMKNELMKYVEWLNTKVTETEKALRIEVIQRAREYDYIKELVEKNVVITLSMQGLYTLNQEVTNIDKQLAEHQISLEEIRKELEPLESLNKSFAEEQKVLKNWLDKKTELEREVEGLTKEFERIVNYEQTIQQDKAERQIKFASLLKEKVQQKGKFNELKDRLDRGVISFTVSTEFDYTSLESKEDEIINHNSGYSKEVVITNLKKIYEDLVTKLDVLDINGSNIDNDIKTIAQEIFESDNLEAFVLKHFGKSDLDKLLKRQHTLNDFYNMLFSDYYVVNYDIKYNGKNLNLLSSGQKGLVLMKLFLKLDNSSKPILIDQPEDNLDNRSVYTDLKDDIIAVKKKRQVIIATHNPNLVVTTDAEQVIIGEFEDIDESNPISTSRIKYNSGGLEDREIRANVCKILEGGTDAFERRERVYHS